MDLGFNPSCNLLTTSGEGNGTPLQCSCLENPVDGGAWWAAFYGVAQSRTRLKRLSSNSSVHETLKGLVSLTDLFQKGIKQTASKINIKVLALCLEYNMCSINEH